MNEHAFRLLIIQAWQITALATVVAVVVKVAAKNRPHLAHALWVLVLIKCVTPPLWGHSLGVFSQLQARLMPNESAVLPDVIDPPASVPVAIAETLMSAPEIDVPDSEHGQLETYEPDDLFPMADTESPLDASFVSDSGTDLEQSASQSQSIEGDEPALLPEEFEANIAQAEHAVSVDSAESDASWLRPGWLLPSGLVAGAIVTLFIMVFRCLRCLRLIHRHRTTEFDDQLHARIQHLSGQLRIRRIPQIIVSDVLFGPAVLGLLRHTIVLPRCLFERMESDALNAVPSPPRLGEKVADRPDEGADRESCPFGVPRTFLDPILAHELLHIRRGDLRTGTLQAIVQSLWWFHPAVWLSNRWLSREAERCCDEQVIAELGCSPAQYARSLLSVIECKHQLQPIPVFPGMKPVEITSQRMERIMSLRNGLKKRTPLWCWLTVAGLAIVVLPGAVAKPSPDESSASPRQASSLPIAPPTASVSKQQDIDTTDGRISTPAGRTELTADERIQPTEMARPVPDFVLNSSDPLVRLVWDAREASRRRLLMTDQRTPWQFMNGLMALRRDFVLRDGQEILNGLEWVLSGPKFPGDPWFQKTEYGGRPDPRPAPIGFDDHMQQFLGALAMNDVPLDAKFATPDGPITMRDMIKNLQMIASEKNSSPWTLYTLSKYMAPNTEWLNDRDEQWSIERLVENEMREPPVLMGSISLMSLAIARDQYLKAGKPLQGCWLEADQRIQAAIRNLSTSKISERGFPFIYVQRLRTPYMRHYSNRYSPPGPPYPNLSTYAEQLQLDIQGHQRLRKTAFSDDIRETASGQLLLFLAVALPDAQIHEAWIRQAIESAANDLLADWGKSEIRSPFYETTQALSIYLDRITVEGSLKTNPERASFTVQLKGQVRNPGVYQAPADKGLRLTDAIQLAGGVTDEAATSVYVIRSPGKKGAQPTFLQIGYHDSQRRAEPNIFLAPGDEILLQSAEIVKKPLAASIRLEDNFVLSPDTPITGTTVIAFVNDKPIAVEYLLGNSWVRLEQIPELTVEQKNRIAMESIKSILPQFLFEEVVLQYFLSSSPEHSSNTADELRHDRDEQLAKALQKIRDNAVSPRSEDDEFFATLLARDGQSARTQRQQLVARYAGGLPEGSIAREKDAVLRHGRQLVLEAQLRKKVSLDFENSSLSEVLRSLAKDHGINIAAKSNHIPTGSRLSARPATVTYHGQDQTLRNAINAIVEPFGLCMKPAADTVMIELGDSEQAMEKFRALPGPPSFAVYGMVKNTGWQLLDKEILLLDAISLAGGIDDSEGGIIDPEGITIEITNPEIMSGKAIPVSISLQVLRQDASGKLNRIVKDGDIISIMRNGSADALPAKESGAGVMNGKGVNGDAGLVGTVRFDQSSNVVPEKKGGSLSVAKDPVAAEACLVLCTYPVADLVVHQQSVVAAVSRLTGNGNLTTRAVVPAAALAEAPDNSTDQSIPLPLSETQDSRAMPLSSKADFAPLTELIKATVQPDSWDPRGTIAVEEKLLSLVIRQTDAAHDEIADLLSQLRHAQDQNVRIQCLLLQLTEDSQTQCVKERCSLHPGESDRQWALLPPQRSQALTQALLELKPEVLSRPQVMTISGQTATIQIGSIVTGETATTGIRLEMTPHLLPDSNILRMQHSFSIGEFEDEMPEPIESLVGSGQTLLLLVNDPADHKNPDAVRSQYLLMMTPEHLNEEEAVSGATPKESLDAATAVSPPEK